MWRLKIMCDDGQTHFTLGQLGRQRLELTFDAPLLVSDAGLLPLRLLDRQLGILDELADRLPDPRSRPFVRHSTERILVQQVYQRLAGYPDGNDADDARHDALLRILADVTPEGEEPLASGSTLNRFAYAYTRKADRPDRREVLLERRAAQLARIKIVNGFLVDLFLRTRRQPPTEVILDLDATDDPVHGNQHLASYNGHYEQAQYLPLLVFEGHSGFPLACWLRHGTAHASLGAIDILRTLVHAVRAAWPGVRIVLRADSGLAVPEVYEFCEANQVGYAIGFAGNAVLEHAVAQARADIDVYYVCYSRREPRVQRFEEVPGYQAGSWSLPRRVVAKIERTPEGSQRRFVVTNLSSSAEEVYRDFYVQRGAVPEQPIGELKNGLQADRLSAHGFVANAWKLLLHVVAYALVVLLRESCAVAAATAAVAAAVSALPTAAVVPALVSDVVPAVVAAAATTVVPTAAADLPTVSAEGVAAVVPAAAAAVALAAVARSSVGTLRQWLWKVPAMVEVRARRVVVRISATWPHREVMRQVLGAVVAFGALVGRSAVGGVAGTALPM
jgi:hypothetical protein